MPPFRLVLSLSLARAATSTGLDGATFDLEDMSWRADGLLCFLSRTSCAPSDQFAFGLRVAPTNTLHARAEASFACHSLWNTQDATQPPSTKPSSGRPVRVDFGRAAVNLTFGKPSAFPFSIVGCVADLPPDGITFSEDVPGAAPTDRPIISQQSVDAGVLAQIRSTFSQSLCGRLQSAIDGLLPADAVGTLLVDEGAAPADAPAGWTHWPQDALHALLSFLVAAKEWLSAATAAATASLLSFVRTAPPYQPALCLAALLLLLLWLCCWCSALGRVRGERAQWRKLIAAHAAATSTASSRMASSLPSAAASPRAVRKGPLFPQQQTDLAEPLLGAEAEGGGEAHGSSRWWRCSVISAWACIASTVALLSLLYLSLDDPGGSSLALLLLWATGDKDGRDGIPPILASACPSIEDLLAQDVSQLPPSLIILMVAAALIALWPLFTILSLAATLPCAMPPPRGTWRVPCCLALSQVTGRWTVAPAVAVVLSSAVARTATVLPGPDRLDGGVLHAELHPGCLMTIFTCACLVALLAVDQAVSASIDASFVRRARNRATRVVLHAATLGCIIAGSLLPALEITVYVSLGGSLQPLGSASKVLSVFEAAFEAMGSTLDPMTPVLLSGTWWNLCDVCSLARPQALILSVLLAFMLIAPPVQGLAHALSGCGARAASTPYGVTDIVVVVMLASLYILPTAGNGAFGESTGGKLLHDYLGMEGLSIEVMPRQGFWLLFASYFCQQLASVIA